MSWAASANLIRDGLLTLDAKRLLVLPAGRLLLRVIASRFDAYLNKSKAQSISAAEGAVTP